MQSMQQLVNSITLFIGGLRAATSTSGLGIFPIIIAAQLLVAAGLLNAVVDALDNGEEIIQAGFCSICGCPPVRCTPEEATEVWVNLMRQEQAGSDPFGTKDALKEISGAIGTVIKVVAIGGAVAAGAYLLWTFGPALIGAGRKVRATSQKKYA
jgi:hypothetical protein